MLFVGKTYSQRPHKFSGLRPRVMACYATTLKLAEALGSWPSPNVKLCWDFCGVFGFYRARYKTYFFLHMCGTFFENGMPTLMGILSLKGLLHSL